MDLHKSTYTALIADAQQNNRQTLAALLIRHGYQILYANNGEQAVELFKQASPDIIFMALSMPLMDGYQATRLIKQHSEHHFTPVIFLAPGHDDALLQQCIDAGADDFLFEPYEPVLLSGKLATLQRLSALNRKMQGMVSLIHREQEIAEQVFNRAVQKDNIKNPHIKSIIRPASTFSGDMILSEYSPSRDIHFFIGDFTGHGLTSALGAMPVSEVFRAMTAKGFTPQEIMLGIHKKLRQFLPVGMFLCAQLVVISRNLDHVTIFNAGMPDLLIVDGRNHQIKHHVKSNSLPLGIIDNINTDEIAQTLPLQQHDKLVIYSDGLTEAWSETGEEFGHDRLQAAIQRARRGEIFEQILSQLETFCGDRSHADDVTLLEINCVPELLPALHHSDSDHARKSHTRSRGEWELTFILKQKRLKETNPVPIIINQIMEMEDIESDRQALFTVMTELYVNALDHGVLALDSSVKSDAKGFSSYYRERELRLAQLDHGRVSFHLSIRQQNDTRNLRIRVEDSGKGFDYHRLPAPESLDPGRLMGRGLQLVRQLSDSITHLDKGNIIEVVYGWNTA
ncbi:MAG: fused response regulator/phosphatase [Gammaproteobacteria bacterium]|nr:fused response regulator/phosphatase [Gammaproteobacteria bacterium]MBL7000164.1 fused response regulator/phosphatase [Gammaproteobacteria bacterium]